MASHPEFLDGRNQLLSVGQTGHKSRTNSVPETSFDSGYCSPLRRHIKVEPVSPELPMLSTNLQASPLKMVKEDSLMNEMLERPTFEDTSIASEWEKDFFENFEENLFNFDFDDKTLDDILRSPKGKVAMNELMKSPKGKAIMNSPKGKLLKDRLKYYDTPEHNKDVYLSNTRISPGILSPSDPNILSATPCKPNAKSALKVSRRKLALVVSGKEDVCDGPSSSAERSSHGPRRYHEIRPKSVFSEFAIVENQDVSLMLASYGNSWPSKERLKFARDMFKRTLEKAVEDSQRRYQELCEPKEEVKVVKKKKKSVKFQDCDEKYPELKQALEKPTVSSSAKRSRRNRFPSIKLRESVDLEKEMASSTVPFYPEFEEDLEDDLDEDYTSDVWKGYVPFTGYKEAKKRRTSTDLFKGHYKRKKMYY